ncbi:hypothetical protein [Clostridium perfringens]|uniref:hypothetical protein n=1 Tax=Clostridium perfringens TaxID=1502 RepID=UPI0024BD55FC|nr:hypothetical protein [Clostridium perfringens]
MRGQLINNEFVEILQDNTFNEKFQIPKEQKIDNIESTTLDFIRKNSELDEVPLQPLSIILKVYGISVETYFRFSETIKEINFDDKEYKSFLTDEYKSLFKEIDDCRIDDLDKLTSKMKLLELAEKSRETSEKNNMKGKVILSAAGTILGMGAMSTGASVTKRYIDYLEKVTVLESKESTIKKVCESVRDIAVTAINNVEKFKR